METLKGVDISQDGKYRYLLWRDWHFAINKPIVFIMLNPSTADGSVDDPTIRRCINFADYWGYNEILVANLYAFRATSPKELWKADDPVGPENDKLLSHLALTNQEIICAWGDNAKQDRIDKFLHMMKKNNANLYHLGLTKRGQPKHPLYLKKNTQRTLWKP